MRILLIYCLIYPFCLIAHDDILSWNHGDLQLFKDGTLVVPDDSLKIIDISTRQIIPGRVTSNSKNELDPARISSSIREVVEHRISVGANRGTVLNIYRNNAGKTEYALESYPLPSNSMFVENNRFVVSGTRWSEGKIDSRMSCLGQASGVLGALGTTTQTSCHYINRDICERLVRSLTKISDDKRATNLDGLISNASAKLSSCKENFHSLTFRGLGLDIKTSSKARRELAILKDHYLNLHRSENENSWNLYNSETEISNDEVTKDIYGITAIKNDILPSLETGLLRLKDYIRTCSQFDFEELSAKAMSTDSDFSTVPR